MIVLETTRPVVETARGVHIDYEAIRRWADAVHADALAPAGHDLLAELPGDREQLANLVLLADALNFCFWSPAGGGPSFERRGRTHHGFNAMFAGLISAAEADPRWFDARHWRDAPAADVRAALAPVASMPLFAERQTILRQTGQLLLDRFDGRFALAAESVSFRAWDLAVVLLVGFDSFRDVASYRNQPVYLAKRAQITAIDLSMAWQSHGHPPLEGLEQLTAFADYRLPQALRHLGILCVEPGLAARIDRREEIAAGAEEEVELRAATIWAVERMRAASAARGLDVPVWQIDWNLWRLAHDPQVRVEHHRTRTTYY